MSCSEGWCNLPVELLVKIFSHLLRDSKGVRDVLRCARVCRNWSRDIHWTGKADLSFAGLSKHATDGLLQRLATTKLSRVTRLDLSGWRNLTLKGLQSITQNCKTLEHLTISSGSRWMVDLESTYIITRDSYVSELKKNFVQEITQIKTLKGVDFSNVLNTSNSNKAFVDFVKELNHNLTELNFAGIHIIRGTVVSAICTHCPHLQVLNLTDTHLESMSIEELQISCSNLEELYLANLNLVVKKRGKKAGEDSPGFPKLRVLDVDEKKGGQHWCTDAVLNSLLWASSGLVELRISSCSQLNDSVFDIPTTKLRSLSIGHRRINLFVIETICEKWSSTLTDLDLSWTDYNTRDYDEIIMYLSRNLKDVQQLNLRGTSVSEVGIRTLINACDDLNSLDLTSCRGVQRGMKMLHSGQKEIGLLRKGKNGKKKRKKDDNYRFTEPRW